MPRVGAGTGSQAEPSPHSHQAWRPTLPRKAQLRSDALVTAVYPVGGGGLGEST